MSEYYTLAQTRTAFKIASLAIDIFSRGECDSGHENAWASEEIRLVLRSMSWLKLWLMFLMKSESLVHAHKEKAAIHGTIVSMCTEHCADVSAEGTWEFAVCNDAHRTLARMSEKVAS
jgi:hypothetical protein